MVGIRCRIYGAMTIVDGVVTVHQAPVDVHCMSQEEIQADLQDLAEERRLARLERVRRSKEIQYQSRRGRRKEQCLCLPIS